MEEKKLNAYEDFLEHIGKTGPAREDDYLDAVVAVSQTSPAVEEPVNVGERIKKFRNDKGLTLTDISRRTNVPVEVLEQIEDNLISPPLGTLIKLGKALDMKMGYLISSGEIKPFTIVRKNQGQSLSRLSSKKGKSYGYSYEMLAADKNDRSMDPFLVTLEPTDTLEELSSHDGQEFIFVLSGQMEVRLDDYVDVLNPGDSIYYDSTTPHLVRARGGNKAYILAVLYSSH
ncbi:MAG: helix-turn-helix transcriptional regulator [Deltaproteobacteria bacterium]|nr:helix-turn-helix transcriptional regulator [Deltaproteobacteria bacterium]